MDSGLTEEIFVPLLERAFCEQNHTHNRKYL